MASDGVVQMGAIPDSDPMARRNTKGTTDWPEITLRMPEGEKWRYAKLADRAKISVSELIRQALKGRRELRPPEPSAEEYAFALAIQSFTTFARLAHGRSAFVPGPTARDLRGFLTLLLSLVPPDEGDATPPEEALEQLIAQLATATREDVDAALARLALLRRLKG